MAPCLSHSHLDSQLEGPLIGVDTLERAEGSHPCHCAAALHGGLGVVVLSGPTRRAGARRLEQVG